MTGAAVSRGRRKSRPRRILMALDPTSDDLSVLAPVAALAARMEAELAGCFVEDDDLLRLAEHPGASATSTVSAGRARLDRKFVERAFRIQEMASRRAIEAAAGRNRVKFSFQVRRGRVATEVLAQAGDADLVVVGWACGCFSPRQAGQRNRPGAVARAIAAGARHSVLLLKHGAAFGGPAMVVYDGTPASDKALAAAMELIGEPGGAVDVVLLTQRLEEARNWPGVLGARLMARGIDAHFLHLPGSVLDELGRAAHSRHAAVVVLGAELGLLEGETGRRLLEGIDCSVLLVR